MSTPNIFSYQMDAQSKLDDSNFVAWKFRMQNILEMYQLWDIVSATEQRPTDVSLQPAWDARAKQAKYLLISSVKDQMYTVIQDQATASDVWQTL